jgi:hypothetical protein
VAPPVVPMINAGNTILKYFSFPSANTSMVDAIAHRNMDGQSSRRGLKWDGRTAA